MEIIGLKRYEYQPQGKDVVYTGVRLFCSYEDEKTEGIAVEIVKVSDKVLADCGAELHVGDNIRVSYNKWGNIDRIDLVA